MERPGRSSPAVPIRDSRRFAAFGGAVTARSWSRDSARSGARSTRACGSGSSCSRQSSGWGRGRLSLAAAAATSSNSALGRSSRSGARVRPDGVAAVRRALVHQPRRAAATPSGRTPARDRLERPSAEFEEVAAAAAKLSLPSPQPELWREQELPDPHARVERAPDLAESLDQERAVTAPPKAANRLQSRIVTAGDEHTSRSMAPAPRRGDASDGRGKLPSSRYAHAEDRRPGRLVIRWHVLSGHDCDDDTPRTRSRQIERIVYAW